MSLKIEAHLYNGDGMMLFVYCIEVYGISV